MSEGSGENERTATFAAALTPCATPADVLPLFAVSPAYVATSVRAPTVDSATAHDPAATDAVHELTPSPTVTLPVGAGPPCGEGTTEKLTLTSCPAFDGAGAWPVMVIVVL